MADVRDFYIIERLIEQQKRECVKLTSTNTFENKSNVFYFVVFKLLFDLATATIDSYITDQSYLMSMGKPSGKESGIDAVYIEQDDKGKNIVHLFTFKHTKKINAAMEAFSSSVIDNILFYVDNLVNGSLEKLPGDYNPAIKSWTQQFFDLIADNNVNFVLHLCGNFSRLDPNEKKRFEDKISQLPLFNIQYDFLEELVKIYINKGRKKVNGKIVVKRGEYFTEKLEGNNCKTLIAKIDALMLLKLLSNNQKLRNKTSYDITDFDKYELNESAFDDNVRMFLGDSTKINDKIIATAESPTEKENFYYYNNGITILCALCKEGLSSKTTFTIDDIQIVNGSQTIHNLAHLCKGDPTKLSSIFLLCRFYSVVNHETHTHIAEYTNSQHQVKPRDIKALDSIQIKLEKEFDLIGIKYERKKNQHKGGKGSKLKRLDSEKCGKMLIAFYAEDPSTARNDPSSIFTSKYNSAFMEDVSADKILIVKKYHDYIEDCRKKKEKLLTDQTSKCYYNIKYSSFFYLFAIKKICDNFNKNNGAVSYELSDDKLEKAYEIAYNLFTLVSHNKLKAAPNTDLSDYFKANSAKIDFCTEFKKISTLSNIEEAKTKSSELLQNGLQQPIIGE